MAETIRGGAFLASDGKTWHDAEGRVLDAGAAEQAAQLQRQRAAAFSQQEQHVQQQALLANPGAAALVAIQAQMGRLQSQEPQEVPAPRTRSRE